MAPDAPERRNIPKDEKLRKTHLTALRRRLKALTRQSEQIERDLAAVVLDELRSGISRVERKREARRALARKMQTRSSVIGAISRAVNWRDDDE